jgi:hypothetical protein
VLRAASREIVDVESSSTKSMLVKSTSTNGISGGGAPGVTAGAGRVQNYTPYRRSSSGYSLNGPAAAGGNNGHARPRTGLVKDAILGYTGTVSQAYFALLETLHKVQNF